MTLQGQAEADMRKVFVSVAIYWVALLGVSLLPLDVTVSRAHVVVIMLIAGIPVLLFAVITLWHAARKGLGFADLAFRDDLTGLQNRRAFLEKTQGLLFKTKTARMALVLMDVDGLKTINDDCGHQAGDELLCLVADRISASTGASYRIGGDEFAIVIDRQHGEGVMPALKHLDPFTASFKTCGHDHRIRLSYGCASNHDDDTFEMLFARADSRLRQHKSEMYAAGYLMDRRSTDAVEEEPLPDSIPSLVATRRARVERRIAQ